MSTEPVASMTAGDVKFSDAISWRPVFWRSTSRSIMSKSSVVAFGGPAHGEILLLEGEVVDEDRVIEGAVRRSWRRDRCDARLANSAATNASSGVERDLGTRQAFADADDVGVVVLAGEAARRDVVHGGGPGTRHLVGRDGDTDAAAADAHAEVDASPSATARPTAAPKSG